jgi:4-diphosphocytidyl-2C-methyl-D-erythritol kinase
MTKLTLEKPFRAIIAHPKWGIETAAAYAAIDRRRLGLTAKAVKLRSAEILGRKRLSATALMRLGNTFERVLEERRSDFISLRRRLSAAGTLETRLTGSGSAVYGVLGSGSSAVGVVGRFTGSERLYVVRSTRRGLRLRQ